MFKLFTILFLCIGSKGFSQHIQDTSNLQSQLILTAEQNQKWLDSLQKLPTAHKISFLMQRLVLDTNVFIRHVYPDGIIREYSFENKNKFGGCCKPTLFINATSYRFDDKYSGRQEVIKEVEKFLNVLGQIKIEDINVLPSKDAVIYGTNGSQGMILIKVVDRTSLKLIKKQYGIKKNGVQYRLSK